MFRREGAKYIVYSNLCVFGIGACAGLIVQQLFGEFNMLILATEVVAIIFFSMVNSHIKRRYRRYSALGYMAIFAAGVVAALPLVVQPWTAIGGTIYIVFECYNNVKEEGKASFFWDK